MAAAISLWIKQSFLVSPVFDRMLYGPYVEARNGRMSANDWTVTLPEDKPAPLRLFLDIAHANFAMIPPVLSVNELYDLAALTNYYNATPLLSPWIEVWLGSIAEIERDANVILPKLLWIFWEFGRKEDFCMLARRVMLEARSSLASDARHSDGIQAPYIMGNARPQPQFYLFDANK
ncbi:hypothetical protein K4F52_007750 [Lecanicillium sp. MT-2017a]|nr:hypothetical protein K4F52_007750 [Lecanicillium sp. MT-2017a]